MQADAFEIQAHHWRFKAGLGHYTIARQVAANCHYFAPDDEDEQVDDQLTSCYNCQYRRWVQGSFDCLAPKPASK